MASTTRPISRLQFVAPRPASQWPSVLPTNEVAIALARDQFMAGHAAPGRQIIGHTQVRGAYFQRLAGCEATHPRDNLVQWTISAPLVACIVESVAAQQCYGSRRELAAQGRKRCRPLLVVGSLTGAEVDAYGAEVGRAARLGRATED